MSNIIQNEDISQYIHRESITTIVYKFPSSMQIDIFKSPQLREMFSAVRNRYTVGAEFHYIHCTKKDSEAALDKYLSENSLSLSKTTS